jgi:quinol monooxygenase YgiN
MAERLVILVTGRVQPGKRDELFALHQALIAPHAGNDIAMDVAVWVADNADEDVFHLFEVYNDPAALERNASSDWIADYMAKAGPLMAGEPTVSFGTPLWAKATPSD